MARTLDSTPLADGFSMPAEFAPHAGCWMLWPERPDNWRAGAQPAQRAFAEVAAAIARFEPVSVGVSANYFEYARAQLAPNVRLVEISHDDAWMRDVGPTFVTNKMGVRRGVDWRFNAWGGLTAACISPGTRMMRWPTRCWSSKAAIAIARRSSMRAAPSTLTGRARRSSPNNRLLNPNRNAELSRAQIEDHLKAYLGVQTVIWLGDGVVEDETGGHIDNLACFVKPGVVALHWTDNTRDPQFAVSADALERLNAARDARGRAIRVIRLPMPGPLELTASEAAGILSRETSQKREAGARLAASYVNFYIANRGIVMPLLDSKTDKLAAARIKRAFPGRKVVGVPAREILLGGGNIHCITQQVPR